MANLCIKTPSSAILVLIFQLLVLRPRPSEHWAQHISKVIWGATRISTFFQVILKEIDETFSDEELDGICSDVSCFPHPTSQWHFFINFASTPKIIKVFRFHNFRSFSDGSPFNWLQWICENYVLNIVQNIQSTKCKVYHFMKLTRSRTTTILRGTSGIGPRKYMLSSKVSN